MKMERRHFIATCSAACGILGLNLSVQARIVRNYPRSVLTGSDRHPLRAGSLERGINYVVQWPYPATPCFLLDLGQKVAGRKSLRTADGRRYDWPGGGRRQSVVACSAICSHKLTHPTRDISFIACRADATPHNARTRAIHCCSEHSQFDPAAGAQVLEGPAPQPLAAIVLEYSAERDELAAVATLGADVFDRFFSSFGVRLALEHGGERAMQPVGEGTRVIPMAQFCRQQVRC
jgi:arsenite oxidase small subunit